MKQNAKTPDYRELYLHERRRILFTRLLKGGYLTEKDALDACEECAVSFREENFAVICFNIEDISYLFFEKGTVYDENNLGTAFFIVENVVKDMLSDVGEPYIGTTDSQIIFIVNLAGGQERLGVLRDRTEQILDFILKNCGLELSAIVGDIYPGFEGLHRSYVEAAQLKSFKRFMGAREHIMCCRDYSENMEGADMQASGEGLAMTLDMLKCVQNEDYLAAAEKLEAYVDRCFAPKRQKIQVCERQYYGLSEMVFVMCESIRARHSDGYITMLLRPENLMDGFTVHEIRKNVAGAFRSVHEFLNSPDFKPVPAWLNQVKDYIQLHYADVNLNVSAIANAFGMNPSYVSRVFQKCTGCSMLDYISRLRVSQAKKLIAAGETVEAAAGKVGFGSTITLRRHFRKQEGRSPSEAVYDYDPHSR